MLQLAKYSLRNGLTAELTRVAKERIMQNGAPVEVVYYYGVVLDKSKHPMGEYRWIEMRKTGNGTLGQYVPASGQAPGNKWDLVQMIEGTEKETPPSVDLPEVAALKERIVELERSNSGYVSSLNEARDHILELEARLAEKGPESKGGHDSEDGKGSGVRKVKG